MLCNWYQTMLTSAESEGVVIKTTTLHDEYFKLDGSKVFVEPTCIPYFEGDYIPGEVENIIKDLNKEKLERSKLKKKDASVSGAVSKTRSTEEKLVGNKRGTRSNPGELCNVEPDKVMKRLGQSLGRIKPNFFVAYLHSRAFAEAADSGQDVSKWTEDDDEEFKDRSPFIVGKDASVLSDTRSPVVESTKSDVDHDSAPMETDLNEPEIVESQNSGFHLVSAEKSANDEDQPGVHSKTASKEDALVSFVNDSLRSDIEVDDSNVARKYIGSTVDIDPPMERELFESRQQLLNYCQSRHYQFDELRRAKYTTMMILHHIYKPATAPKFLPQCGACYREISSGIRFHCLNCPNYDLCQDCYQPVVTGAWAERDPKLSHCSTHNFSRIDMATAETEKSTGERSKSVKLHLDLLEHCATCEGQPHCTSHNCNRMRGLFLHLKTCETTYRKGCKVCSRFITLLSMHSRQCAVLRGEQCPIPYCDPIRERNYRVSQQQQQMDDRRRQAQNDLYSGGNETPSTDA